MILKIKNTIVLLCVPCEIGAYGNVQLLMLHRMTSIVCYRTFCK